MKKLFAFLSGALIVATVVLLWPLPGAFNARTDVSTRIEDRSGKPLYDVREGGLQGTEADVPEDFALALISTEDRSFRRNIGLNFRGILRAAFVDLKAGRVLQGGSSITQQYVRMVLQPNRRGFMYKIREAMLALRVTLRFSKEEILRKFAGGAYFGQQAYGLKAAARTFFDTTPEMLSLSQSALLAGLLNAPTALNPFKDIDAAKDRRDIVLRAMLATRAIDDRRYQDAISEPLVLARGTVPIEAPHFVFWLLEQRPKLRRRGGDVRTTIDLGLQHAVEEIVRRKLADLSEKNVTSAAVVVLDAHEGDILAMVGSPDYFDAEHDGAVNGATALRQPGSALKPFTYALAFTSGMTPATTVADISTQFFTQSGNPYVPRNYDYREHGLVRLREALGNSYNIPAVKILERLGVERLLTLLQRSGITSLRETPEHYGLALTLGDGEVRLLELATAYGLFARKGETLNVKSLVDDPVRPGDRVLDEQSSWLVTDILSDRNARAEEFGRSGVLNFDVPVAAKTGTTRNSRDNWTVGFTPDVIVGVWVGNPDNSPMRDTSGITGAGPIFHDVMLAALQGKPSAEFAVPPGIVEREICRFSGMLPTPLCPERMTEHFTQESVPTEEDNVYVSIAIDRRNGLRAGPDCPEAFVVHQTFMDLPVELRRFGRENNLPLVPETFSPACPSGSPGVAKHLSILAPAPNTSFQLDPLIPDKYEEIVFTAQSDVLRSAEWYVDDLPVGAALAPDFRLKWAPVPGSHTIKIASGSLMDAENIEIVR